MKILKTKIRIPPSRTPALARSGLKASLDAALERRLGLIVAPAGYGKTSILADWSRSLRSPLAWLSLDAADNDPESYIAYWLASMAELFPEAMQSVAEVSARDGCEERVIELVNAIDRISETIVFVLDDFHLIEAAECLELTRTLLERCPANLHLVISSRTRPQLPLARLRARDELIEWDTEELRFSPEESREFLRRIMGLSVGAVQIETSIALTEGWPAGLQLSALATKQAGRSPKAARFVSEYLQQEILSELPADVARFVTISSITDRYCPALCAALCDISEIEAEQTIESLEADGYFVHALGDGWYRYHQLFSDGLRQVLREQGAELLCGYHHRAFIWFKKRDLPSEALRHALQAEEWDQAAEYLEQAWERLALNEALGFCDQLPEPVLAAGPGLLLCRAEGLLFRDRLEEAEAILDRVDALLGARTAEEPSVSELSARVAVARAFSAQSRRDLPEVLVQAQRVLDDAPQDDHVRRGQATALIGLTHWSRGELEQAEAVFTAFTQELLERANIADAASTAFVLAQIRTELGMLDTARRGLEKLIELFGANEIPADAADVYRQLAELSVEEGRAREAAAYLKQARLVGDRAELLDWKWRLGLSEARLRWMSGDLAGALQALEGAERERVRNPLPMFRPVWAYRVFVLLDQGRHEDAEVVFDDRPEIDTETSDYPHEFPIMAEARLRLESGSDNLSEITDGLLGCLHRAREERRARSQIELLALIGRLQAVLKQFEASRESLAEALKIFEEQCGSLAAFLPAGSATVELLEALPDANIRRSSLHAVRALFGRRLDTPGKGEGALLSRRELDVLSRLACGDSNLQAADRLCLSLHTVKAHARNIYAKLGVTSRTGALATARELGILDVSGK